MDQMPVLVRPLWAIALTGSVDADVRDGYPLFYHRHGKPAGPFRAIIPDAIPVVEIVFGKLPFIEYDKCIDVFHLIYEPEVWPVVWLMHRYLHLKISSVLDLPRRTGGSLAGGLAIDRQVNDRRLEH
jgi:hypothetical protein